MLRLTFKEVARGTKNEQINADWAGYSVERLW